MSAMMEAGEDDFYSRASCEARPAQFLRSLNRQQNFYSRASCEARHLYIALYGVYYFISTHAPLARRDVYLERSLITTGNFYSRASCEARRKWKQTRNFYINFYSRASCEARRC